MQQTPKGMRLHIGIFGRRNAGKSSLLNALTGQDVSIVSPYAGTTTDPVDKAMELQPLGPVLFIDTAGIDDEGDLGNLRIQQTLHAVDRCDMALLVVEEGTWTEFDQRMADLLRERNVPTLMAFSKADLHGGEAGFLAADTESANAGVGSGHEKEASPAIPSAAATLHVSARTGQGLPELRQALIEAAPESFVNDPHLVGDIVPAGSVVVLVVPIDKEAPKGRLILPQVQTIRDLLDSGCMPLCTRTSELAQTLAALKEPPALVVTDSQAFAEVAAIVPDDVPLTGFSVAMSRFKGDLPTQLEGALAIDRLTPESRVLIAEACTHHPIEEDIGTVKIPRALHRRVGEGLTIDHVRGKDFPEDLSNYDLVIHCGACMFNRRTMLSRIEACRTAGVPIANYGMALAHCSGILNRAARPFPGATEVLDKAGAASPSYTDALGRANASTNPHADASGNTDADANDSMPANGSTHADENSGTPANGNAHDDETTNAHANGSGRLALAQCCHPEPQPGQQPWQAALEQARSWMEKAAAAHAQMVVFPENFMAPWRLNDQAFAAQAQPLDGPFVQGMQRLARDLGLWCIFTTNELQDDAPVPCKRIFNTAVVLDAQGAVSGTYRKMHLFDKGALPESARYAAGDQAFQPIDTPLGRLGLGICFDLRFPELARKQVEAGAEIMVYPASWFDGPDKITQWNDLLQQCAVNNKAFVAGVSRADQPDYIGSSRVVAPNGDVLAQGGRVEELVVVDLR